MAEADMLDTRTDMLDMKTGMLHKRNETICVSGTSSTFGPCVHSIVPGRFHMGPIWVQVVLAPRWAVWARAGHMKKATSFWKCVPFGECVLTHFFFQISVPAGFFFAMGPESVMFFKDFRY